MQQIFDSETEKILYELKAITLWDIDKIVAFCDDNKLPYIYLKKFVSAIARIPNESECKQISSMSIDLLEYYISMKAKKADIFADIMRWAASIY